NHWYDGHRRMWFATLSHPEDIVRGKDSRAVVYAGGGANELMTGTRQWNTGIVARGRIYFPADNKVYAFRLPTATPMPTATPTPTAIADRHCDSNSNCNCQLNSHTYSRSKPYPGSHHHSRPTATPEQITPTARGYKVQG
ncbi:MAG: hypothetical protein ACJ8LV_10665, partial [Chthoniobacterales bacterium]